MCRAREAYACRGAAMVEMAIVAPVLVLLLLGLMDYAWMFYRSYQITNAARHSVRAAVVAGGTDTDASEAAESLLTAVGFTTSDYTLVVDPDDADPAVGEPVTVTITVPYANAKLIGFVPGPTALVGTSTMAKEGP